MAITYQFNKTSLQALEKNLKMRQRTLPTLQNKESALRLEVKKAKAEIKELVAKRVALSDKAKEKVAAICKEAEKKANPTLDDDSITGNYNNIGDVEILEELKKKLLAVRK